MGSILHSGTKFAPKSYPVRRRSEAMDGKTLAGPGERDPSAPATTNFDYFNRGETMKIRRLLKAALATTCCVVCASIVNAKPGGGNAGQGVGNSSFGHSQAFTPQTGSANSSFGRTTAQDAVPDAKKRKKN